MLDKEHVEQVCKYGQPDACRYLYVVGCNQDGPDWRCASLESPMKEMHDLKAFKCISNPQLVNCQGVENQLSGCNECSRC